MVLEQVEQLVITLVQQTNIELQVKVIQQVLILQCLGGTVGSNIYGGGYGYTELLTLQYTITDAGALYGNSNITISGGTVTGNIFGAGRGTDLYGTTRAALAQMIGNTTITMTGNPTVGGSVFGAGEGINNSTYAATARLTGNTDVHIAGNIGMNVYGGGFVGGVVGSTNVDIESGNVTGTVYGAGNMGSVSVSSTVNISGGSSGSVYGGGQSVGVPTANINLVRRNS